MSESDDLSWKERNRMMRVRIPIWAAVLALAACLAIVVWIAKSDKPDTDPAQTGEYQLSVAVASNVQFAMQELIDAFATSHPHATLKPTFGSSGNFHAQILNGAPFDVYFSADSSYPEKLQAAGVVVPESLFVYAIGTLVVWVPNASGIDVEQLGMAALEHPSVKKIALANPAVAPYGRAAVAAITHAGIHDRVSSKFVLGENVSQTSQFVESGAAEIGLIPLPLAIAMGPSKGRFWRIPPDTHEQLAQAAVILKRTSKPDGAKAFMDFVRSPQGKAILAKHGLEAPTE